MDLSNFNTIDISNWIIYFPRYTCVYEQLSSCDCQLLSHIISQSEILGQATYRTWWKHIDPISPTFSCFPYSSMYPLHCQSSVPVQPVSISSVLAKSIQEHLVWQWQPSALGIPKPWCQCLTLYRIHRLPHSSPRTWLDYPNHNFSSADIQCWKCFRLGSSNQFRLEASCVFWFGRHLILEFVPQAGPLQTKLVAKVIFLTIYMQPHNQVEFLTRKLWWSLLYLKCIQQLSFAWFEREIPSE